MRGRGGAHTYSRCLCHGPTFTIRQRGAWMMMPEYFTCSSKCRKWLGLECLL